MAVSAAAAEKQFGLKRHYVHLLLAVNKTTVFINFLEGVAVQVAGCSVGAQDVDDVPLLQGELDEILKQALWIPLRFLQ